MCICHTHTHRGVPVQTCVWREERGGPPLTNWCGEVPPPLPFFSTNVKRKGRGNLVTGKENGMENQGGGEREKGVGEASESTVQ